MKMKNIIIGILFVVTFFMSANLGLAGDNCEVVLVTTHIKNSVWYANINRSLSILYNEIKVPYNPIPRTTEYDFILGVNDRLALLYADENKEFVPIPNRVHELARPLLTEMLNERLLFLCETISGKSYEF